MLGGNLLDLHSAFRRGHDRDTRSGTIQQHAKIKFTSDVAAILDVDPVDRFAFRTSLRRHQSHADHALGYRADLFEGFDDLDTPAFAPSAGMDLGLHYPDRTTQLLSNL